MNHQDHVRLIENGVGRGSGGVWADFGAGDGAFTLALRDIAGPAVEIYAVDRDRSSLGALQSVCDRSFPGANLHLLPADFTHPLDLPPLDGILAANAVHFVRNQVALLAGWRAYLKPSGRLVIVEYDADQGNRWVPYPLSFVAFGPMATASGYEPPTRLLTVPSRFLGGMYAAMTTPAPIPAVR
ncbi:MAG: class I SAM-dependent methyltransferase [Thermomicrobiales bacterium]